MEFVLGGVLVGPVAIYYIVTSMHSRSSASWLVKLAVFGAAAILVLLPFHATLTVSLSQLTGHYTLLRLWKEVLLVPLAVSAAYLGLRRPPVRRQVLGSKLFWLIVVFAAVQVVWGVAALKLGQVGPKALGYGWIIDTRFLVFFVAVWVLALISSKLARWWPYFVFIPALVVAIFGLLQYFVLPHDFMKHLGYNSATIFPFEDINNNTRYIRIMSTLRGANPLGTYFVLVITLFIVWSARRFIMAVRSRLYGRSVIIGLYAVLCALALMLSFSRGAWVGLIVGLVALAWLLRQHLPRRIAAVAAGVLGAALVGLGVLTFVAHNPVVQNIVLHTEDHSVVASTSNEGHTSALQTGVSELLHEPLGRGPGTAGPASVYNTGHPGRIAENYFVQIGQETGWVGLLLFIAILSGLARVLYRRRDHVLALGLLAALAGLTVVSLTSHAWADDTLAYVYWGLAGIACALPAYSESKKSAD